MPHIRSSVGYTIDMHESDFSEATPRVVVLSGSLNLRYGLLATGRFVTMIPDSALHYGAQRASIRILPINLPRWHVPTCVGTLKDRTLSPMAQLFIDCLHELAKPLARGQKAGPKAL